MNGIAIDWNINKYAANRTRILSIFFVCSLLLCGLCFYCNVRLDEFYCLFSLQILHMY